MFRKLWTKLINGAAVDALAEFDTKKKYNAPTAKLVETFLMEASKGEAKEVVAASPGRSQQQARNANPPRQSSQAQPQAEPTTKPPVDAKPNPVKVTSVDNKTGVMLEARDRKDNNIIHRSYIAK